MGGSTAFGLVFIIGLSAVFIIGFVVEDFITKVFFGGFSWEVDLLFVEVDLFAVFFKLLKGLFNTDLSQKGLSATCVIFFTGTVIFAGLAFGFSMDG